MAVWPIAESYVQNSGINYLRERYAKLKQVYVFGSYVKGTAGIDSDIDIAVIFDEVADTFDLQVQLMKIRRQYDARIEPHVFRAADFNKSYPLVYEIIETGMEI